MDYKKLLVISHNCFSKTGSNGRTLANYLMGWPKEKIAQMYIHLEYPDFDICDRYYCISDGAILKSILRRSSAGFVVQDEPIKKSDSVSYGKKKSLKNSSMFLMRELAWRSKLWNAKGLEAWLNEFSPELILVQAGDAAFLFDLSIAISKKYKAQVVIYNTEGYYFKKVSYLPENKISRCFYPILNHNFKNAYKRLISISKCEIYNCDLLADDYEKVFHSGSQVIMNTSEFTDENVFYPKKEKIIYAGNLGLNRHKSLIEFANALKKVDSNMVIDVYGKTSNKNIEAELDACAGIRFHGFISYEELKQKIRESKYLLHVESFDSFYKEDLKYAFSTKIADSLAVGACLFIYAPQNMAVSQYFKHKNAAVLITEPEMLVDEIKRVLNDEQVVQNYSKNGRELAESNHNIKKNREAFLAALLK